MCRSSFDKRRAFILAKKILSDNPNKAIAEDEDFYNEISAVPPRLIRFFAQSGSLIGAFYYW